MTWARPVPLIGDRTSAADRAADPQAWAFSRDERAALYAVLEARRDIRRFRPDAVPSATLERVLGAAHAAPSVGHSQPWRFVIVQDPATRERAAAMADRHRQEHAARMEPESARRLLDLQLEGIREAPLGIIACCDRRTPAAGVLGRATYPDADMWSCACAIQNLWLAARAEGLGVGWVTLFQPTDLGSLLGLPEGVETLGWLCLGWPDERPPAPGLERAGWSRRTPVDDVIVRERWPDLGSPGPPVSHLRAPSQDTVVGIRDDADELLTPPGSLGVLDRAIDRVLMLGDRSSGPGMLVLVGADHPVTRHGVSAYPRSVTTEVLRAAVAGEASGVVAAKAAGMGCLVVDAGVGVGPIPGALPARPADERGDLVSTDAMSGADTTRLVDLGRSLGLEAAARGIVALGEVGVGNTTVAAALLAVIANCPATEVVGQGAGADSDMTARKVTVVELAVRRAVGSHGDDLDDPLVLLQALGGPEIALLTGTVLGAAQGGAAVVLDGLATSMAAALAVRLEPAVSAHLVAGQRSRERGHPAVLALLGLEPLLDLRLRAGEGVGACLAVRLLHDGLSIRRTVARTDSW